MRRLRERDRIAHLTLCALVLQNDEGFVLDPVDRWHLWGAFCTLAGEWLAPPTKGVESSAEMHREVMQAERSSRI